MGIKTKINLQCRPNKDSEWSNCFNPHCTNNKRTIIETIVSDDIVKIMRELPHE